MKAASVTDMMDYQMQRRVDEERFKIFKWTQRFKIGPSSDYKYFRVDEKTKLWYYDIEELVDLPRIFRFEDITDFEYLEDNDTVISNKGELGRALVGGALFGGVGAIVGGVTSDQESKSVIDNIVVKITTKDRYRRNLIVQISPENSEMERNGFLHQTYRQEAEQLLYTLAKMTDIANQDAAAKKVSNTSQTVSGADEILKYKQLMDMGIINAEEFEAKKKQILGL